jgi:hypothetical protein
LLHLLLLAYHLGLNPELEVVVERGVVVVAVAVEF